MRYKKFYIIVLCLLFLLTGCVKGNVNIDFQNIDDVEMNVEILLPKSFYNSYATSIDKLKNALKEKNLKDWQSEDLKKSINGVSYLGFNFIAPETINKLLLSFFYFNKQENNYHVEIDLSTINNIYNTSELKNISNYSLENLKDMGLEVNLNIIMPGEIIKTNVGKINDNKVQINLLNLLTQNKISTISLVSKEKTNNSFVINFIVIIILIFILYRIIRKSK